jgi:hypothetical protein
MYVSSESSFPPCVDEVISLLSKKGREQGRNTTRQRECVDIGFTTNRCSARQAGCDLGLTRPRQFAVTSDALAVLSITGDLLDAVLHSNVMEGFEVSRERKEMFASVLHHKNLFEAIRIHATYVTKVSGESICKTHCSVIQTTTRRNI